MLTNIYKIKVLTNLHAGSGDAGYGIVDKLVQRDAATNLPAIYASGIKGALREYFENLPQNIFVPDVFGDDENGSGGAKPGAYRFLSADILSIPMPMDTSPYYMLVFDQQHVAELQDKYRHLHPGFAIPTNNCQENITGFKYACENLPVIARNHLESGQSVNLWYEEIVPHKTEFITAIQYPAEDVNITDFNNNLHNSIVQIGGNASVGYGLCLFTKIN